MDPNELTRLEALFHALSDIPKGPERDAAAIRLSGGDRELARRALDLLRPLGNKAPPALVFQTKFHLAYMESLLQQNPEESRRMIDEALALSTREPSISQSDVGRARSTLGAILINNGKYAEGESVLRESIQAFQRDRRERPSAPIRFIYW